MTVTRLIVSVLSGVFVPALMAQNAPSTQPGPSPPGPPPASDPILLLSRAMMLYNAGDYAASEAHLTRLLEASPQDVTARFLRALSCGQQAVPHDRAARRFGARGATETQQPQDQAARERVQTELDAARQFYERMRADLDILLQQPLGDREAILHLLDAVAQVKLAGMPDQQEAKKADLMEHARQALVAYVRLADESKPDAVTALNRIRGRFFLGVVLYRQAVPTTPAQGPPRQADLAKLAEAHRVLGELVDPAASTFVKTVLEKAPSGEKESVPTWLSYPYFYLGLIRIHQAGRQTDYRRARNYLAEAEECLNQAQQFDSEPSGESRSGVIKKRAGKLVDDIHTALAKVKAPQPYEDFRLDWQTGFAYDRNVILLGKHTSVPRDIGRRDDVRFDTGISLGYTLDLAKADRQLQGLTLGLGGRASSDWHGDISSFNEQDYGASIALQYELLKAHTAGGSQQGPLYAAIQYDYDYFLLGNNGFLRNNRVTPRLTLYTFDQRAATTLGFRYEDRNYLEDLYDKRMDRDGNYFAFFLNQSLNLADMSDLYRRLGWQPWGLAGDPQKGDTDDPRWLRPYVGVEYGWDATMGDEWDDKYIVLASGLDVPLPYGVMFDVRAEWEWENYGGTNGGSLLDFHRRGRDDLVQRYQFGFERSFVLVPGAPENRRTIKMDRIVLTVRANILFTDDHSNVEDRLGENVFSYKRAIYGLSVALSFN